MHSNEPRAGFYRITPRGLDLLASHREHIGVSTLAQFEEFRAFHTGSGRVSTATSTEVVEEQATPEEQIDAAYAELRQALIVELQERISGLTPLRFEQLVLDVLGAMGYGASGTGLRTGGPGDAGIDGVIEEDRLGLDVIYVQAKKWSNSVQRPDVHAFVGALQGAQNPVFEIVHRVRDIIGPVHELAGQRPLGQRRWVMRDQKPLGRSVV